MLLFVLLLRLLLLATLPPVLVIVVPVLFTLSVDKHVEYVNMYTFYAAYALNKKRVIKHTFIILTHILTTKHKHFSPNKNRKRDDT